MFPFSSRRATPSLQTKPPAAGARAAAEAAAHVAGPSAGAVAPRAGAGAGPQGTDGDQRTAPRRTWTWREESEADDSSRALRRSVHVCFWWRPWSSLQTRARVFVLRFFFGRKACLLSFVSPVLCRFFLASFLQEVTVGRVLRSSVFLVCDCGLYSFLRSPSGMKRTYYVECQGRSI